MRSIRITRFMGWMACALACTTLTAEVTIRDVNTVTYGDKASVIISYEGTDKIQFFAINPAEGVLTLDFPGVVSLFDFEQLTLELIERVEQVPLDPDSNRGVGVHFYLSSGVNYDIYESDPGTLILFFERMPEIQSVASVVAPEKSEVSSAPAPVQQPETLAEHFELTGVAGEQKLHRVTAEVDDLGGRLQLTVQGEFDMSGFRLNDPPRYAVDLKGVVTALTTGDLIIERGLLERVRVRQFQVHPEPITRLVMDLVKDDLDIRIERSDEGARVTFADHASDLDRDIAVAKTQSMPAESDSHAEVALNQDEPSVDPEPTLNLGEPEQAAVEFEVADVIDDELAVEATAPDAQAADANDASADVVAQNDKPAFDLATDIDAELAEFSNEHTFYDQMKKTRRTHGASKPIEVTNAAIEEALTLGEARSMQEDYVEPQMSNLFDEVEAMQDDSYERIDGGQGKYRGFEIQKIDVKDANVVDLLRFLSDQVGFNLYVDPSVQNLKATYSFRNIPWDQAMDIILRNANLDWEFENGVLRVATTQKFKEEAEQRRALMIERELSVPPETVTFPLSYAKVREVVPIIEQYLSPRGTILFDERTNTLIIEDIPKRMVAIRTLIRRLDTRIPQVSIEARIVETTKRFVRELGIQWGLSAEYSPEVGTDTGVTFPNRVGVGGPRIGSTAPGGFRSNGIEGGYAVNFPVVAENPSGIGLSLGNFLNTFQLDISLQMLESEGQGQIISAPKVITQNNKTALVKNGQKIPIQTVQRGTITVRYIDAVLELEVTPQVTNEKTIIMDLVVDKSEADFTRNVLGNPVINVRRAETRVLVKDGGTAVIGGIFVLNEQASSTGIPGLRKIPVVRRLFSSDIDQYENQELLIFITPRIVKY